MSEFYIDRGNSDGLQGRCKECNRVDKRDYRDRNREKVRAAKRRYRLQNLDRVREYERIKRRDKPRKRTGQVDHLKAAERNARYLERHPDRRKAAVTKYYRSNRDRAAAASARWKARNKDRVAAATSARRARQPERTKVQDRIGNCNRYARKKTAFVEHVKPMVVFNRDKGVCGICGDAVAIDSKWHIDHVIPLARGGKHSYNNVQLAHASCNCRKRAKILETQIDSK